MQMDSVLRTCSAFDFADGLDDAQSVAEECLIPSVAWVWGLVDHFKAECSRRRDHACSANTSQHFAFGGGEQCHAA